MNTTHTTPWTENIAILHPNGRAIRVIRLVRSGSDPTLSSDEEIMLAQYREIERLNSAAAQSQPAPPVPASVQEIMPLVNAYVRTLMKTGPAAEAKAEIADAFKPLEAALTALIEKNHELQFSLDGVNAMRRPLTDEQCKDLLAAAFFIAAKDDVTALMMDEDAERTIKLLCELSGFEPPDEIGIEPEQGESHE